MRPRSRTYKNPPRGRGGTLSLDSRALSATELHTPTYGNQQCRPFVAKIACAAARSLVLKSHTPSKNSAPRGLRVHLASARAAIRLKTSGRTPSAGVEWRLRVRWESSAKRKSKRLRNSLLKPGKQPLRVKDWVTIASGQGLSKCSLNTWD
jgi:hypothetical protein